MSQAERILFLLKSLKSERKISTSELRDKFEFSTCFQTGFINSDVKMIKSILPNLIENDASSARPEGSLEVQNVIWWEHSCASGVVSSAKNHRSLRINSDGFIKFEALEKGL